MYCRNCCTLTNVACFISATLYCMECCTVPFCGVCNISFALYCCTVPSVPCTVQCKERYNESWLVAGQLYFSFILWASINGIVGKLVSQPVIVRFPLHPRIAAAFLFSLVLKRWSSPYEVAKNWPGPLGSKQLREFKETLTRDFTFFRQKNWTSPTCSNVAYICLRYSTLKFIRQWAPPPNHNISHFFGPIRDPILQCVPYSHSSWAVSTLEWILIGTQYTHVIFCKSRHANKHVSIRAYWTAKMKNISDSLVFPSITRLESGWYQGGYRYCSHFGRLLLGALGVQDCWNVQIICGLIPAVCR